MRFGAYASSLRSGGSPKACGRPRRCWSRCRRIATSFTCARWRNASSATFPAALATLARLEQLHPRFSRLYQERGHCHVALKQAPAAIDAFLRGVRINPALPASWSMLEGLYRMTGQTANAADAAAHVATLKQLPPEVVDGDRRCSPTAN